MPESHLLPPAAYDTHVHVFDKSIGPYDSSRSYTPAEPPLDDLLTFERSISATENPANVVLAQPSPYRNNNHVLLATLQRLRHEGFQTARGIAVFDPDTIIDVELERMNDLGIRGLRLNIQSDGSKLGVEAFKASLISVD